MPTEAVDTGVSDQELFDQANADDAPADEAVVESTDEPAEQVEQPRDDAGRFASKAENEPKPPAAVEPPAPPPVDDNAAMVPSWRVREINEEKRALAAENERLKAESSKWQQPPAPQPVAPAPKVEKPDPLLDPEGYEKYLETKFEEKLLNNQRESSLANAHRAYKTEFEEAYAAAQKQVDPVLRTMMQNSRDPGETLIKWHREQKTRAEVGDDPNAYFDKRFEAYLADPANQAKVIERIRGGVQTPTPGAPRQAAPVNLPPSLTRATNASSDASADDDDVSDNALWRHANA